MSYIGLNATRWAWAAPVASSSERLVLLALAKHADEDGGSFPSADTLAEETRLNRKTVFSALTSLCEGGLIVRSCRSGQGRRNQYELRIDSTENGTYQKRNDPKTERSSSQKRDFESTENGTSNVPNLGHEYRREERREKNNEERSFSPAFACDAPADGVAHKTGVTPSPDDWASLLAEPAPVEDDYPADLFSDVDPATAKVPAPKPRTNARTSSSSTSSRAKPKRLCPFDLDAVIPDDWRDAFAADYPTLDLAAEFRKFVGWHVAKGNTYADWKAAFRNWLGNAVKFQARDRNYSKDNRHDVQASRQGSILTPQSEYDYAEGLRIFEARRAARRARDA